MEINNSIEKGKFLIINLISFIFTINLMNMIKKRKKKKNILPIGIKKKKLPKKILIKSVNKYEFFYIFYDFSTNFIIIF